MGDRFNYSLMVFEPVRDETSPPVNLIDAIETGEEDPLVAIADELYKERWGIDWGGCAHWTARRVRDAIANNECITLDDSWYRAFQDIQVVLEEGRVPYHLICHPKYEYPGELVVYHPDLGSRNLTCDDAGQPYVSSRDLLVLIEQSESLDDLNDLKRHVRENLTIEAWKEKVGWT